MDFKVITDADGSFDNFVGAHFTVLDSGVLEVKPKDGRKEKRVLYGPAHWYRVDVTKDKEVKFL